MAISTYGDLSHKTAGAFVRKLLTRGQHTLVIERFGQFDPQPKKHSKTRIWRRYHSLALATAPLAEDINPPGQALTYVEITATLELYGDSVKLTRVANDTIEDPVLEEMSKLCGEQIADTVETIRIAVLKAGSNVVYAAGVASRSLVTSPPVVADLHKIYRAFKKSKGREISEVITATARVGTEPVGAAYFAMGHTDLAADIAHLAGFVPPESYASSEKAQVGEVGKTKNFRFVLTGLFDPWTVAGVSGTTYLSGGVKVSSAAACDVYPLLFLARDAYGIVPLQGEDSIKPVVLNPGTPDKSDYTGQRGYVSWTTMQAAAILNQDWLTRYECAATAEPNW